MVVQPGPDATELAGRDRELTTLRTALAAAMTGHGSLVLIGGEAGIGKTALAEALLAEAYEQGVLVLVGRCYDLTETPPYGPWAEALVSAPHDAELPALPVAVLPPERGGEILANQEAILARVRAYLEALSTRQSLVLLLDDFHWADPASLDLLRLVARGLTAVPLLLLATYRADEIAADHALAMLLPLLTREARAARLDLRPLDQDAIAALVAARYALGMVDQAYLVGYLTMRTEGNALFLGELLRTLEDEGLLRQDSDRWTLGDLGRVPVPALLRQVIGGRVARLTPETGRLLAVAAVVGQEVPLALWAAVAGQAEGDLLDHAERALAVRLLVELPDGSGVRFAHALVRDALYTGLGALRRRGWHRRAAEVLAAAPQTDPSAVAYHFRQAGDARAVEWLERAGERAQQAYAWLTAAARYEAALSLLGTHGAEAGRRGWLTYRLAWLLRLADRQGALAHAAEAVRLAAVAGDPLLVALGTFLAGSLRCFPGLWDRRQGIPQMEAGLAALAALPPAARVPPGEATPIDPAPLWGGVILHLGWSGRYAEALARGERYLAEVPVPAPADWDAISSYTDVLHGLGQAYAGLGQPGRARAALARTRELYQAIGHHHMVAGATWDESLVVEWYETDHSEELARLLALVRSASERATGINEEQGRQQPWDATALLREGRWAELGALAQLLINVPEDAYLHEIGWFDRAQGRPDAAWARVRRTFPDGPDTAPGDPDLLFALPLQRLAANLSLDAGDLPLAREWLAAHDRWLDWSGAVLGRAEGHLGWAAYHRAAGDLAGAQRHAAQAFTHASEPRQPLALLTTHRTLGELDIEVGQQLDAAAHLVAALALADACAATYERAVTLLALAELHAANGEATAADARLVEARGLLEPLEARPALARAAALIARIAATPVPPIPALPFGLTAREAEVLRLVVAGLTNPQVAERLFVTSRTVNAHLTSVYTKLGVAGRAAAIRVALDHGLR